MEAEEQYVGVMAKQGPQVGMTCSALCPRVRMWKEQGGGRKLRNIFLSQNFFELCMLHQDTLQAVVFLKVRTRLFKITFGCFKSSLKSP